MSRTAMPYCIRRSSMIPRTLEEATSVLRVRSLACWTPCCAYPHAPRVVSLGILQMPLLLHSQIRQDLGIVLSRCDDLVARGAVISYGLAVGTGMTAVMAAEAARRIHVAKVIRVRTPADTHVGEDIAEIDRRHLFNRLLHRRALRAINLRVIRSIEVCECVRNTLTSYLAGGIIYLEKFDCLFLDVGKHWANTPERHLLVHSAFGRL